MFLEFFIFEIKTFTYSFIHLGLCKISNRNFFCENSLIVKYNHKKTPSCIAPSCIFCRNLDTSLFMIGDIKNLEKCLQPSQAIRLKDYFIWDVKILKHWSRMKKFFNLNKSRYLSNQS